MVNNRLKNLKEHWIFGHSVFYYLFLATVIITILPFIIYGVERILGILPNKQEWYSPLGNYHGPWRYTVEGVLMWLPFYSIVPFSVVIGLILSVFYKKFSYVIRTIFLVVVQIILFLIVSISLFWTID